MCSIQDLNRVTIYIDEISSTWSSGTRKGQYRVELHSQHVLWLRYFLKLRILLDEDPRSGISGIPQFSMSDTKENIITFFKTENLFRREIQKDIKYDQSQFIQ